MKTLVVVAQHRNQYFSNSSAHGPVLFGSFRSSPSRDFREVNCRTFQSITGIASTPLKTLSKPVNKQPFSSSPLSSPKTPSPSINFHSEDDNKHVKRPVKSSAIAIPCKINGHSNKEGSFDDDFPNSELWAGPAYSNSPPPSSLPIPKFSLRQKRTVSLDLPSSASKIDLPPMAKSAPPSPKKEHNSSVRDLFSGDCTDSATKTLRRILNLDI